MVYSQKKNIMENISQRLSKQRIESVIEILQSQTVKDTISQLFEFSEAIQFADDKNTLVAFDNVVVLLGLSLGKPTRSWRSKTTEEKIIKKIREMIEFRIDQLDLGLVKTSPQKLSDGSHFE